jgi:hypothetical protein
MFHRHHWVTTGAHYNPPPRYGSIDRVHSGEIQKILQGFTNVTQTCTGCGRVVTDQHPGRVDVGESVAT